MISHGYDWLQSTVIEQMLTDQKSSQKFCNILSIYPYIIYVIYVMTFHIFSDSKWSWRNHPWPSFDWFDLHSWSRGLAPNPEGKDEESTSEPWGLAAAVGNRHAVVVFFGEVLLKGNVQKLFKGECLNEYVSHWTSFLGMQFFASFCN